MSWQEWLVLAGLLVVVGLLGDAWWRICERLSPPDRKDDQHG